MKDCKQPISLRDPERAANAIALCACNDEIESQLIRTRNALIDKEAVLASATRQSKEGNPLQEQAE